jgi:HAD superfamily phosphoserine phosphatase-like hydrolase
MAGDPPELVLFDVCDTLYAENTTAGFLRHFHECGGNRAYGVRQWMAASRLSPFFYVGAAAHRWLHYDLARTWLIRSLKGMKRDVLQEAGRTYVRDVLPLRLNPVVHERLEEHRRNGDRILLVSSSLDIVIAPVAELLGVEWRSSELEFRDGRCTGRLGLDLTGRKQKVAEDLVRQGEARGRLRVYTDNLSDLTLLKRADAPVVIIPAGRGKRAGWGGVDAEFIEL